MLLYCNPHFINNNANDRNDNDARNNDSIAKNDQENDPKKVDDRNLKKIWEEEEQFFSFVAALRQPFSSTNWVSMMCLD